VINRAWDHNSYYQPRLLRALPARCERVLDVGCGAGDFAITLHRLDTSRDLPLEAVSMLANISRRGALICLPAGRRNRREMYRRHTAGPAMPIMDSELTIRQVRRQAERALPGATVRRLVLWRYELVWRKPER
jgi:hypothetical protein